MRKRLEQQFAKFEKNEEGLYKLYDRFSFDGFFRILLNNGFEHEEALNFILCSCSLSALIFQERIYNKYCLKISCEETISSDLVALRDKYSIEILEEEIKSEIERLKNVNPD